MTIPEAIQFVPLVAAPPSAEKREFRVTVIPQKEQPPQFQSLGKTSSATGNVFNKNCEPHLSVQRDGERITSIRIQCNCGQTIDLACIYEEPPKPSENGKA